MFNLGMSELILIAVLALIFIGPKQLPEVAKAVGRLMNEFKKASGEITDSFSKSALSNDIKKALDPNEPLQSSSEEKKEKKDETPSV